MIIRVSWRSVAWGEDDQVKDFAPDEESAALALVAALKDQKMFVKLERMAEQKPATDRRK